MTLERSFTLRLSAPPEQLAQPDRIFGHRPPFRRLELHDRVLYGELGVEVALLGDLSFPFRSVLSSQTNQASLTALPLEEPVPPFWAELWGTGQASEGALHFQMHLRLHAQLPQAEKWGGKALRHMAERVFAHTVDRILEDFTSE